MPTLEELKAREQKLWEALKPVRAVFNTAQLEWSAAYAAVKDAEMRERIQAEIEAEKVRV